MEAITPVPISSVPALAAAIRRASCHTHGQTVRALFDCVPLVPMYHIQTGDAETEALAAAHVLREVADRMRRLAGAYGEWDEFDAGAYFDLSPSHVERLVKISDRVRTVHVTFFADLLLPSFQQAERYWAERFCPAYWRMRYSLTETSEPQPSVSTFQNHMQPYMVDRWTFLSNVLRQARAALEEDLTFPIADGSDDERIRWRHAWQHRAVGGLDHSLQPQLQALPSMTLSVDFPLPATRQPGRLRRLRADRARLRRRTERSPHWRHHVGSNGLA